MNRFDMQQSRGTMKRKLFGYMMLLVFVVVTAFVIGLSLMGHLNSTEKDYYETLDIQMEVFEKDMEAEFDHLAFMGIHLSEKISDLLDGYLKSQNLSFDGTVHSNQEISNIQDMIIEPLKQQLLQTECSGAFVMMNISVNRKRDIAADTKSGIYLQKKGVTASRYHEALLLYRGDARIGKRHEIMPHRKWKLEFEESLFPRYAEMVSNASLPPERAYFVTDASMLPGTSEKAMHMIVPVIGNDGTVYGICGFELTESYFKSRHAQASKLPRLTCILTADKGTSIDTTVGLNCGVQNGYYLAPDDTLAYDKTEGKLVSFLGGNMTSIGLMKHVSLQPTGEGHLLVVMIPQRDYACILWKEKVKTILLFIFLLIVTIISCLYLSRRFVQPILGSLSAIKNNEKGKMRMQLREIDDLFAFLSERDRKQEEALRALEQEKEQVQEAYEKVQEKIERLAYSRKQEIDPDDYACFLQGLEILTATEKKIFEYYLSGNTVKEIMQLANIKESTLRYHNQNIYRKLGVNSLKQMLRYAALWQQEEEHKQG